MKVLRTVLFATALGVSSTPAHAALIGMIGGDYDPPPITDPGAFGFVDCNQALANSDHPEDSRLDGAFCIFYNAFNSDDSDFVPFDEITSLDFILTALGEPQTTDDFIAAEFSDLPFLNSSQFSEDGLRLSGGTIVPNDCFEIVECQVVNAVALFILPEYNEPFDPANFLSRNIAVNDTSVPEPATLLLMGPAAAVLLMRRRRKTS